MKPHNITQCASSSFCIFVSSSSRRQHQQQHHHHEKDSPSYSLSFSLCHVHSFSFLKESKIENMCVVQAAGNFFSKSILFLLVTFSQLPFSSS